MKVWLAVLAITVVIVVVIAFVFYIRGSRKNKEIHDSAPEEFKDKKVSFADEHGLPLDDSTSISEIEKATNDVYARDDLVQTVEVRDTITPEPVIDMPSFQMGGMLHNAKTEEQLHKEIPKYTQLLGINRREPMGESNLKETDLSEEPMGMMRRTTRQMAQPIKPHLSLGMRMMGAEQAAAMIKDFEKKPEDMKQANMVISKIEEKKKETKDKKKRKHRKGKDKVEQ